MRQRVLVSGAVFSEEKILLLQRQNDKKMFPGFWEMPGGKVDEAEDPNIAVLREVKEETGLDVVLVRPFNVWSCVLDVKGETEHCIEIDYFIDAKDHSTITLSPKEHAAHQWFGVHELPTAMSPEMRKAIMVAFNER